MYLTKFTINPARRDAQRLLSNPQRMHAAVLMSFPDPTPTDEGRILYRIDRNRHRPVLLISGPKKPDLTHFVEQAGWSSLEDGWDTRDYSPVLQAIQSNERLFRFRFTANPVIKKSSSRKRLGHVTTEQKLTWFSDRADNLGVSLRESDIIEQGLDVFKREQHRVTLSRATFEGVLQVKDSHKLEQVLRFGYGHGKAYGCGLLTLATL